jgi:hypothetical protein
MQLTQVLYVSSYADEHGFDLPNFMKTLVLAKDELNVRGMTLFANGNIMQLLEGNYSVVTQVFGKLQHDARNIGTLELLKKPLAHYCLAETSIGYSLDEFRLISKTPHHISIFKLHPAEVEKRISRSPGQVLMTQFASDYGML